jgi:glycosyltransferase involved in cell wall biosynthesis
MTKNNYLVKIFPQPSNRGIGVARQRCLEYATGDYVAYLSADDCYDRRFIEKSLPYLNTLSATYTAYYQCDKDLFVKATFTPPSFSRESVIDWALEKNMYINFSSIIIPRQLGVGFEESLRHGEDLVFLLDTLLAGLKWHLINEPLVYYRIHNLMGSKTQPHHEFDELWTYLKDRLPLLGIHKDVIDKAYEKSYRNMYPPVYRKMVSKIYHFLKS